jgi:hypothetical protein
VIGTPARTPSGSIALPAHAAGQRATALVWGAGIATPSGQTNPAEQRIRFGARPFRRPQRCQRENAKAGCIPLTPIRLEFTAPVERELLDRISLKDAQGKFTGNGKG